MPRYTRTPPIRAGSGQRKTVEFFGGAMVVAWRANQVLNLTDEQEKLVNEVRSRYKFVDETLEDLERYLGTPYPKRMYQFPMTDRTRYYYISDMMNAGIL